MVQAPSPGDSSGWPDGYEDLESGDNGFPGDTDEGETAPLSRAGVVVVGVGLPYCRPFGLFHWEVSKNKTVC